MHTKKGITLVETIMAIAVLVAGMTVFTLLFIRSWEMHEFAFDEANAQLAASHAMQRMTDLVRNAQRADNGAFPLVSVADDEIVFYGNTDGDGDVERIRLALSGTSIVLESRDPTDDVPPTYPSGYDSSQTIVAHLVDTDTNPVFTFYDDANAELTGSFPLNDVKMVKIDISVDEDPTQAPDAVVIESFASIRNLNEHDSAT